MEDRIKYWKKNAHIFGRSKTEFLKFGNAYMDGSPTYQLETDIWRCCLNESYAFIFDATKHEIKKYNLNKLKVGQKMDIKI